MADHCPDCGLERPISATQAFLVISSGKHCALSQIPNNIAARQLCDARTIARLRAELAAANSKLALATERARQLLDHLDAVIAATPQEGDDRG